MIHAHSDFLDIFTFLIERSSISYFFHCLSWCLAKLWEHMWQSFNKYCGIMELKTVVPSVTV